MLHGSDLVFGYTSTPVLRGVSIRVPAGGLVGLIGPNGSGKTTLLRLLAGTRRPARGRVMLDGVPLASLSRAAVSRRLAVVPQETHPAFDYSVLEMVLMGRYPHLGAFAVEGPRDLSIARAALAATGADFLESRPFSTLSGGEKQRVVIAAALAQITTDDAQNVVLLLDEPTAALDLKYQLGLAALLRRLHGEQRLTIVISTHDLAFAAGLCASIVMLKNGQVIAAGPTDEVLTSAWILELYGVEAEIVRHPGTGRLNVVPLRVVEPGPPS